MTSLRRHIVILLVVASCVAAVPPLVSSQGDSQGGGQESSQEEVDKGKEPKGSAAEDVALGTASVLVSAAQIPLRAVTCGATTVVAGIAYLLTAFNPEARQGPADAIKQVCGGSYITTPEDLKRD